MDELRRDHAENLAAFRGERWVRLMCDYSAEGVWQRDGVAIAPEWLPIRPELALRIHRWQEFYEEVLGPEDIHSDKVDAFAEEGLAIAIQVKQQLPDWTVIYHDERRSVQDHIGPGEPYMKAVERLRPWFEYEVTQQVMQSQHGPDLDDAISDG